MYSFSADAFNIIIIITIIQMSFLIFACLFLVNVELVLVCCVCVCVFKVVWVARKWRFFLWVFSGLPITPCTTNIGLFNNIMGYLRYVVLSEMEIWFNCEGLGKNTYTGSQNFMGKVSFIIAVLFLRQIASGLLTLLLIVGWSNSISSRLYIYNLVLFNLIQISSL